LRRFRQRSVSVADLKAPVEKGAVICIGRYNPAITDILAAIKPDVINHTPIITFENGPGAVFAFDPANPVYNSNMLFEKPYLLEGSTGYPLRWKFMTTGSGMDPNYSSAEELGIIIYGGIFYSLVLIKFAPNPDGLIQILDTTGILFGYFVLKQSFFYNWA
jgi:hypothetical protein